MDLTKKRILIAAQYAAQYPGNFISSLMKLEDELHRIYKVQCAYLFPALVKRRDWYVEFANTHTVYTSGSDSCLISSKESYEILSSFRPDIVYTHFEGYDIPLYDACNHMTYPVSVVWHMHDTLSLHPNPLKAISIWMTLWKHYGLPVLSNIFTRAKRPSVIYVCPAEKRFIRQFRFGLSIYDKVIPNGIDLGRVTVIPRKGNDTFRFLSFGGRPYAKGIDILLQAASRLANEGIKFKVQVTVGCDTEQCVKEVFGCTTPSWLELINQTNNVSELYAACDCFVSASRVETFSYAVGEASISGLPIIQSDIEGTAWNLSNPSVLTFKSEDINSLCVVMKQVMEMPSDTLQNLCSITVRNNIREYSLECWCNKIIHFFKGLPEREESSVANSGGVILCTIANYTIFSLVVRYEKSTNYRDYRTGWQLPCGTAA